MKKFYALALAAAVALSANAERLQFNGEAVKAKTHKFELQADPIKAISAKKAPAKVTAAQLEGLQYWYANDLLRGGIQTKDFELTITNTATGAATLVLGMFEIEATVNLTNNTVTIANKQYLGEDEDGDIYFYLKGVTADGDLEDGALADASVVGTYEEGNVLFPEMSVWAFGDPENEVPGWYYLTFSNVFTTEELDIPEPDPYENYELIGKGKFLENIVYGLFQDEENTTEVEVDVYVSKDDENVILITNPLKALYEANGLGEYASPDLEFDLTDPTDVYFALTNTGLGNQNVGNYLYGSTTFFYEWGIIDEDEVVKSTYIEENGKKVVVIPAEGSLVMTSQTYQLYMGSPFESVLTWGEQSGIDNVVAEQNGPAVYYNLQGVRVNNPAKGGVYVRVQNGKAAKIVK